MDLGSVIRAATLILTVNSIFISCPSQAGGKGNRLELVIKNGEEREVEAFISEGTHLNKQDGDGRTLLHYAAIHGQLEIAKLLIKSGAEIKLEDKKGITPLAYAVKNKQEDLVLFLDEYEKNPLHTAVEEGFEDLVEKFLKEGIDREGKNEASQTPIHLAAMRGHERIVELLMQWNVDVNAVDKDGETPLHWSVFYGHERVSLLLIQRGAQLEVTNKWGRTPLHEAANRGRKNLVGLLLSQGADPNPRDRTGMTPRDLALKRTRDALVLFFEEYDAFPLHVASENAYSDLVQTLIRKGHDVELKNEVGRTPLHLAAIRGNEKIVLDLLIQGKANVNSLDHDDESPLHWAAYKGHKRIAEMLIKAGAQLNTKNKWGRTPLHEAIDRGHREMVELLIRSGGDVSITDNYGATPVELADKKGYGLISKLLSDYAAEPLHWAARAGYDELIELLLKQGLSAKVVDKNGETPLHWSAFNGRRQASEALIQGGAPLQVRNKWGRTPLHEAVDRGHKTVVELFLEHDADITLQDGGGRTPLILANQRGHVEIVSLLERYLTHLLPFKVNLEKLKEAAQTDQERDSIDLILLVLDQYQSGERNKALATLRDRKLTLDTLREFATKVGRNVFSLGEFADFVHCADSETVCSVCLDSFCDPAKEVLKTPCNHYFCKACIQGALQGKDLCPNCRTKIPDRELSLQSVENGFLKN